MFQAQIKPKTILSFLVLKIESYDSKFAAYLSFLYSMPPPLPIPFEQLARKILKE
jgi:hypothetical protein